VHFENGDVDDLLMLSAVVRAAVCMYCVCMWTDHSGDLHSDCLLAGAMSMALCCILSQPTDVYYIYTMGDQNVLSLT